MSSEATVGTFNCPECGHPSDRPISRCPHCGLGLVGDKVSPDLLAWARQTFDEKEYLARVKELETNGGVRFESIIGEIEEMVRRHD